MLRELEHYVITHPEIRPGLETNATIVGSGIMGLLMAKKLIDLGQTVVLLDSNPTVAYGASIKNHGWLHRGSAHSVSVKDPEEAKKVVSKLIYGHEYLRSYALECVEEPFEPIFTMTQDDGTAQRAVSSWSNLGVFYEEIPRSKFLEMDPQIRGDLPFYVFKTADLKINNRMLFSKLLTEIRTKGGIVINNAVYDYKDPNNLEVTSQEQIFGVSSEIFIYCTGAKLGEQYARLTGKTLPMSFWKSHLLYLPRFSPYSVVSLDRDQPIIINHADVSVINRAYDEIESDRADYEVDQAEVERSFHSLCSLYPSASLLRPRLESIACSKPSIKTAGNRYSVNSSIFEPLPNHYFMLPGKMTEAPYVADELLHRIYSKLDFAEVAKRPIDRFLENSYERAKAI